MSSPHEIVEVPGPRSEIQFHVPVPIFYVRLGVDEPDCIATMRSPSSLMKPAPTRCALLPPVAPSPATT